MVFICGFFALCGVGLIGLGLKILWDRIRILTTGIKVGGTITGFEPRTGHGDNDVQGYFYLPKVEFTDRQGNVYQFISEATTLWGSKVQTDHLAAGKIVRVVYNEKNPEKAQILNFLFWFPPLVLIPCGVLSFVPLFQFLTYK